jgi:hypothetical protein
MKMFLPLPDFFLLLHTTTMPKKSDEAEDLIQEALQAYHDRGKPKISVVAREFGVDYQRLVRRVRRPSRSGRQGTNNCLDKPQEQALVS